MTTVEDIYRVYKEQRVEALLIMDDKKRNGKLAIIDLMLKVIEDHLI